MAPALPADAARHLRGLLLAVAHDDDAVTREQLRAGARIVGAMARRAGLRPEQLIVAVKEMWRIEVESRPMRDRVAARAVLTDLVSLCVTEYFRAANDEGRAPRTEPTRPQAAGDHGTSAR